MYDYTKIKVNVPLCEKETITSYLRKNYISDRYMTKLRKKFGYIRLNGQKSNANSSVKQGDEIEIFNNPDDKSSICSCIAPLDIVFEDNYILIVNKPAGLPTMPTKSHYDLNLAGALMNYMLPKQPNFVCRIINRLDKDVSGLVLVAKNSFSASFFDLKDDAVKKTYNAIAYGNIPNKMKIEKNIKTIVDSNGIQQMRRIISPDGLSATTHVSPLQSFSNATLVSVTIENGRTHQIRVHLSSEGHPLLGDYIYGEYGDEFDGIALLCKKMAIIHPLTRKLMTFNVPYSNSFQSFLYGHKV